MVMAYDWTSLLSDIEGFQVRRTKSSKRKTSATGAQEWCGWP